MGMIVSKILFGSSQGPVEKNIIHNLSIGKRVIVSFDNDATIFQMHDGKVRVTKAVAGFYDEPVDLEEMLNELDGLAMDDSSPDQPADGVSNGEKH